jgi:hypothetical protein
MQRQRIKWRADRGARAVKLVDQIRDSIARLDAEDLLDLHDIFAGNVGSPLESLAAAEMEKRNLRP